MAGYIGANTSSVTNNQNAAERRKKFTFTANTTALTGLNFLPNKIHIFHNGIRLVKDTDFTEAADGQSVTLINAAQAGDEVVAVTFEQNPAVGGGSSYADADVDAHLLTAGVTLDATNDRVGINESTPTGSLHVKGTSTAHGKIILEAGGSGGSANNNYMEFNKHDGTKLAEIAVEESVSNGGDVIFKTTPSGGTATERWRITHDGHLKAATNGLGIDFSAVETAGANPSNASILDDYEEGAFTPTLSFATAGNSSVGYSARTGTYVKVGKIVTFQLEMRMNGVTKGTGSGHPIVGGFPFNFHNSGGYGGSYLPVSLQYTGIPSGTPYAWGNFNSNFAYLITMSNSSASTSLTDPSTYAFIGLAGSYVTTG